MAKQVKKVYRILAWFFSAVVAAGTLMGCGGFSAKYGPPTSTKYGPPAYNTPKNAPKSAVLDIKSTPSKESERTQES